MDDRAMPSRLAILDTPRPLALSREISAGSNVADLPLYLPAAFALRARAGDGNALRQVARAALVRHRP
jgi:hypothetical protein